MLKLRCNTSRVKILSTESERFFSLGFKCIEGGIDGSLDVTRTLIKLILKLPPSHIHFLITIFSQNS